MEESRTSRRNFPEQLRHLSKKQLICVLLGFAALVYAGTIIPRRISLSPTPSVGHYVFLYKKDFKPTEIHKGTLVILPLYTKLVENCWPCTVIKYVQCGPGDRLEVKNHTQFFCNGVFLGVAKTHSKKGVPVKVFQYNGIIPPGKFFAMGTHKDSYDSRYVGLEDIDNVQAIAKPII